MVKRTWKAGKTLKKMESLREIFKDRNDVEQGLTRYELISLYKGIRVSSVLNWKQKKIDLVWVEIGNIKRMMRQEKVMAIIHKSMRKGTILKNEEFGNRMIKQSKNIFFRCSSEEDAWPYRSFLDKISKSIFKASQQIEQIVEREAKQKVLIPIPKSRNR